MSLQDKSDPFQKTMAMAYNRDPLCVCMDQTLRPPMVLHKLKGMLLKNTLYAGMMLYIWARGKRKFTRLLVGGYTLCALYPKTGAVLWVTVCAHLHRTYR